ncbi:hypothetical protein V490_08437 [Pseudogymnoascus sp. VKM F-3557]|nr:hypothetical protein V490_08437 [Pseudogymnoascus sp. VKM F-3557]
MSRHHPDLVMCRKQPGISLGRLCDKCDGKCPVCDAYVRPTTLVRICDECSFGNYQNKCVVCGGEGISDAFYCFEWTGGVWGLVSDGCGFGMEGRSEGRIEEGRFTGPPNEGTETVSKGDTQGSPDRSRRPDVPSGARQVMLRVCAWQISEQNAAFNTPNLPKVPLGRPKAKWQNSTCLFMATYLPPSVEQLVVAKGASGFTDLIK